MFDVIYITIIYMQLSLVSNTFIKANQSNSTNMHNHLILKKLKYTYTRLSSRILGYKVHTMYIFLTFK